MKKLMQKITVFLCVMGLLLSMAPVAFVAAEGEPIDITNNSRCTVTPAPASFVYNGQAQVPQSVTVTYDDGISLMTLIEGVDYRILGYANNINVGTATVTVEGMGNYKGQRIGTYPITKADQILTVSAKPASFMVKKTSQISAKSNFPAADAGKITYKSSDTKIATVNSSGLVKGKAPGSAIITVTAAGSANCNPATAQVKVTVKGYEFTKKTAKVTLSKYTYTYDGKKKQPGVTVKYKGKKLKKNKDYKVKYEKNKNAGKAQVTVTGKGLYTKSVKKTFTIKKAKNNLKTSLSSSQIEIGREARIKVTKSIGEVTFKSSNSKVASVDDEGYITSKKEGTVTITVTAAGDVNHEKATKKYKVTCGYLNLEKASVSLSQKTFVYNGEYRRPSVTVKISGRTLKKDRDFTVSYYNNKNAGNARVVIKAKGKYRGSRTVYFKINKADQKNMTAKFMVKRINVGETTTVFVSGARGKLTFGSNSPSYLKHLGNGEFKALKPTMDHVSVYVIAAGDENYKSKKIDDIRISIDD